MADEVNVTGDLKSEALGKQNEELNNSLIALSSQIQARRQAMNELFEANVNLKASNILLENSVKKFAEENKSLKERILSLESVSST